LRITRSIIPTLTAFSLVAAPTALAAGGGSGLTASSSSSAKPAASGGAGVGAGPAPVSTPAHPIVQGSVAKIVKGVAYAPADAPIQVQKVIWAGNQIRKKPYVWGGGHAAFIARGYDCSGSVSYVLHAAGLLKTPYDSSEFESYGKSGLGRWITVYTNPGHAFVQIAGIRLDTSREADPHPAPGSGPRWRPLYKHPSGFDARHPTGY
jgi:hypothetical protein